MKGKLTSKEEKFCYEYCIDFNATQAAIRAGYSEKTARTIGSKLLTLVNIQAKIKSLKENLAETAGISALKIIKEHEKIAFSHAGKIRSGWMKLKDFDELPEDVKGCIQEVQTKEFTRKKRGKTVTETYVKVKLYDKQKSLDSISNILGYNAPIKTIQATTTLADLLKE